jgi:hypothetical protein
MYDYRFISPSLEGILTGSSITYEGVTRPVDVFRVLDGPSSKARKQMASEAELKLMGQYFQDLHGVFLKKIAHFALETAYSAEEGLKLQAMLQEMIKVKKILGREIEA